MDHDDVGETSDNDGTCNCIPGTCNWSEYLSLPPFICNSSDRIFRINKLITKE